MSYSLAYKLIRLFSAVTEIGDSSSSSDEESNDENPEEYVVTLLPERNQLQKREGKKRVKGIKFAQNDPQAEPTDAFAK